MTATAIPPVPEQPASIEPSAPHGDTLASDVHRSLRNALKLGLSLVGTWAVALVVRIYLPRQLGPAGFGVFQFADAFTATLFVLLNLGLETYIRKEVATRPAHAAEFFGGTLLVRLVLSVAVTGAAIAIAAVSGKPGSVLLVVTMLSLFQIVFYINGTYAAMLHATSTVNGLSFLNVGAKITWGLGIVLALRWGGGVASVGLAMLLAELGRLVGLIRLTRRHLGIRFHIDLATSWAVLRASLPFNVLMIAQTAYGRLDVTVMSFLTTDVEVGWYGAAATIAGLAFLLSPLIQWVVTPLSSRAAAQSSEALMQVTRRGLEIVLTIAIPSSLVLGLGADPIVRAAFGTAYMPAVRSLELLAPTFVLTYAGMLAATVLIRLERGWTVTAVLLGGMVASPVMNVLLIPRCLALFGQGGAGIAAATTLVVCELGTTVLLVAAIGARAVDRRLVMMLAKTSAVVVAVVGLDFVLRPIGNWRLLVDGIAYSVLVLASGAVNSREATQFVRDALRRRGTAQPSLV